MEDSKTEEGSTCTEVGKAAPRVLRISARGIKTSKDYGNFMAALMCDVVEGLMTTGQTNAACNAGAKLLKNAELELKYGTTAVQAKKYLKLAE